MPTRDWYCSCGHDAYSHKSERPSACYATGCACGGFVSQADAELDAMRTLRKTVAAFVSSEDEDRSREFDEMVAALKNTEGM